jgi:hypothetical protein
MYFLMPYESNQEVSLGEACANGCHDSLYKVRKVIFDKCNCLTFVEWEMLCAAVNPPSSINYSV